MKEIPWRHVHFTGIGGVGMCGLALICRDFGIAVSGTDAAPSNNLTLLSEAGASVAAEHAERLTETPEILVYSTAIPETNPERQAAVDRGIPQCRRGEFLPQLAQFFPVRVSCAGSHGKTTISAMLSHLLRECDLNPGYLVGGMPVGFDRPASAGDREILVTEVDESDATQALMDSTHAIVSNVEDDHCWNVGGPDKLDECFRTFAFRSDRLVTIDSPKTRELFTDHPNVSFISTMALPTDLRIRIPGEHNRVNATLALEVALQLGVTRDSALQALENFGGVDRRMSVRYDSSRVTIVEDYAHHPTEVRATVSALREAYPGRLLTVVFQPHRFERVARYCDEFCDALSQADSVVVTAPFAAWTEDADLADPSRIADGIRVPSRYVDDDYDALAKDLVQITADGSVVAVLGAGDVTKLIKPLTHNFMEREEQAYAD
jgi:UDP-N-acetylmuramate--alanine ligase